MHAGLAAWEKVPIVSSVGKLTPPDVSTLTDVFDNPSWLASKGAVLGLDVDCTKAAVDLQNLRQPGADEVIAAALETLRCTGLCSGSYKETSEYLGCK